MNVLFLFFDSLVVISANVQPRQFNLKLRPVGCLFTDATSNQLQALLRSIILMRVVGELDGVQLPLLIDLEEFSFKTGAEANQVCHSIKLILA